MLDEASKPKAAAVEFPVVNSVRTLVVAASELPQLKTLQAAEWKKRVTTRATSGK
jgi:hypothetical protein